MRPLTAPEPTKSADAPKTIGPAAGRTHHRPTAPSKGTANFFRWQYVDLMGVVVTSSSLFGEFQDVTLQHSTSCVLPHGQFFSSFFRLSPIQRRTPPLIFPLMTLPTTWFFYDREITARIVVVVGVFSYEPLYNFLWSSAHVIRVTLVKSKGLSFLADPPHTAIQCDFNNASNC